jgi:hypothetical protein
VFDRIDASIGVIDATIGVIDAIIGVVDATIGVIDAIIGVIDASIGAFDRTIGVIDGRSIPLTPSSIASTRPPPACNRDTTLASSGSGTTIELRLGGAASTNGE